MATVSVPTTAHEPTSAAGQPPKSAGQRFVLYGVDWATYRKLDDLLTGHRVKFMYDRGYLETTTSSIHGKFSRLLGRFVAVLTEELELSLGSYGDMTCDREDLERGIQPDECYYIMNEPRVRGRGQIDLATDPPPDLAIEIDISRSSGRRLDVYAALRVPEVWRFDGEALTFFQLGDDGRYTPAEHSRYFPLVTGADLVRFLRMHTQADENQLARLFREWVREQINKAK
jgi:Uma2 family endonuclease